MFDFGESFMDRLKDLVHIRPAGHLTDLQFIRMEIQSFLASRRRRDMLTGKWYFKGKHDILSRERQIIGVDGKLETVHNIPNNRIVDNQYRKMVIQKTNYLLGKPITVQADNEEYGKMLKQLFGAGFLRTLKAVGEDSLNCGIGWLFLTYNDNGELVFKRFSPHEIIPGWADADHTVLEYFIRIYEMVWYTGTQERIVRKVEVYDDGGVSYFELTDSGRLEPDGGQHVPYFTVDDESCNWSRIPLIPFKYNHDEIPLIRMVKSLQDGLNLIESNFQNQMEEEPRNTLMVLVNYDGENLAEFRKNLATFGAVKVRSADGADGDVRTLQVEVSAENYRAIIELFKKAIIENAMGYDAKDDRMAGNPNQMNIQSMYSDIDLDANSMETEFQAAFEQLLWFVDNHLYNTGQGDFEHEDAKIIFNRDMMINESEVITNCQNSAGLLSEETLVAQHPWVDDVEKELERMEQQKQKEQESMEQYAQGFQGENAPGEGGE